MATVAAIGAFIASNAAVIGLGVAAAGAGFSVVQGRRAAKAQQNANNLQLQANRQQQKVAENSNRLAKIQSIRRARIASANTQQQAVNAGASSSSSASASASNPFVQAGSNIGFQNQQTGFMRTRNAFLASATASNNRAIGFQQNAATASAVAGLATQAFGAFQNG